MSGHPASAQDAWALARTRFCEDLSEEEALKYQHGTLESIYYDASVAEKTHQGQSRSRELAKKIEPFTAAVEQYGQAMDVFSNAASLFICPLWGAMRVCLHLAREFEKYFDRLVDMFVRIGDVLPRFRIYEKLFPDHDRLRQALSKAYVDVLEFCRQAKLIFRKKSWPITVNTKLALKLTWKPFDRQFGDILDNFRNHQKSIEKEAGLSHMIEGAEARALEKANRMQLERDNQETKRLGMLRWLSPLNYSAKQNKLRKLRHMNTCDWLKRDPSIQSWMASGSSKSLLLHGIPGCGKSVLTSYLIDILNEDGQENTVIYFYCDHSDQRTLNLSGVLSTLAFQLLRRMENFSDPLVEMIERAYDHGLRSPSNDQLLQILSSATQYFPEAYIIVDGLDECERGTSGELLSMIKRILEPSDSHTKVKVLISSREEGLALSLLESTTKLKITESLLQADMEAYVAWAVRSKLHSEEMTISNPVLESEIVACLSSQASGMFLWVFFQMEDLCAQPTDAGKRKALNNLPRGLIETYQRITTKLKKDSTKYALALKVFGWAACAQRPLTKEEMREAIAFDIQDTAWTAEKIPHWKSILESSGNLITLDDDDTIRFAHHTVQQYLFPHDPQTSDDGFELEVAKRIAAELCIAYLCFSDFETQIATIPPKTRLKSSGILDPAGLALMPDALGIDSKLYRIPLRLLTPRANFEKPDIEYSKFLTSMSSNRSEPSVTEKYRFLDYATTNWIFHIRDSHISQIGMGSMPWRLFRELVFFKRLFVEHRAWKTQDRLHSSEGLPYWDIFDWAASKCHYNLILLLSIHLGEPDFEKYLKKGREKMLYWDAACQGNQRLLEIMVPENAEREHTGRVVFACAACGYAEIIRQYCESDPKLVVYNEPYFYEEKSPSPYTNSSPMAVGEANDYQQWYHTYPNPLICASAQGHVSAARALVELGARPETSFNYINANTAYGGRSFVCFSSFESDSDGQYGPITDALQSCHAALHAGLLKAGIVLSKNELRIFWSTQAIGHDQVSLSYLMMNGILQDRFLRDTGKYETVIRGKAHLIVNELLRPHGYKSSGDPLRMDGHPSDPFVFSAMQAAAGGGHMAIARILLQAGAEIGGSSGGLSPLEWACRRGHAAMVSFLLANGASLEKPAEDTDSTALIEATKYGHLRVVQILLAHIDDSDTDDEQYASDTDVAVLKWKRQLAMILRAMKHSLDSALLIASQRGFCDIADELLRMGADTEVIRESGGPALYLASSNGHTAMVKLLLSNRARIEATGYMYEQDFGWTPLEIACSEGHFEVVKELLVGGATPNSFVFSRITYLYCVMASEDNDSEQRLEIIRLLLEFGANLNALNIDDETALDVALRANQQPVIDLLLAYGAKKGEAIYAERVEEHLAEVSVSRDLRRGRALRVDELHD